MTTSNNKRKQLKLKDVFENRKPVTKERFEKLVVDAVLDANLPTQFVENNSVKALLDAGFPGIEIHRTAVTNRISKRYELMINSNVKMFEDIKYVCLTADCWTSYRRYDTLLVNVLYILFKITIILLVRSFLGITAHWIDVSDLSRKSCTLACRRIKGSHKAEILAVKLDEVISGYKLSKKVVRIVTDNGSNFVKAFKLTHEEDVINDDELDFFDLTEMLDNAFDDFGFILPPHKRCAAHTANLTMSSDMKKQITNNTFKKMEESAMGKCNELFKKQRRSSLAADFIKDKIGRYLVAPSSTRWNYVVDSLRVLLLIFEEKPLQMNAIFENFNISNLTQQEIAFLNEYAKVRLESHFCYYFVKLLI